MVNIKVYDFSSEDELETKINLLAEELEEHNKEIIDIKYSTSHFYDENYGQVISFSALVMYDNKLAKEYKPKRYEIVEKVEDK